MGNVIQEKSKKFAVRIVLLYQAITDDKKEFVMSKQLLRCGTSIGANVREASQAQSKKDFIHKMNIALKEAAETEYWLEILFETNYIPKQEFTNLLSEAKELNKILISIIKTSKNNEKK